MINGDKEVGPNAVFAFKREGYKNTDISIYDTLDSIFYQGFLNFLRNNFYFAMGEFSSSIFLSSFVKKAKKLIPDIKAEMLEKGNSGVRAQAMEPSGELIMDFRIINHNNQIHILNAPSPGATASLSIADYIIKNHLN
jgi:L-2-hydroxyglutarate oxidase